MNKRWLAILLMLVFLMCSTVASAEIDLSGMSFEELIELREQVNYALWETDEWQEVEVPQGVYRVGEDIPAGKWTVRCVDGGDWASISWGPELSENGEKIVSGPKSSTSNFVYNPNHKGYSPDDGATEYTFTAVEGDYVVIYHGASAVVFTPYVGKPSLGFK